VSDLVLLATSHDLPDGEPGAALLTEALTAHGLRSRWVVWDDAGADWSAGLVALRSTWDYDHRRDEFLDWTASLPWVLNGADVFGWNTDKAYLVELASAGVSVVPTIAVDDPDALPAAVGAFADPIVKPRVGAGGRGVVRGGSTSDFGTGPWVVQPLVWSVRDEGEYSVYVIDGAVVSAFRKVPAVGEIRVHEQYGGRTVAVPLTPEASELARRTVAAAGALLGHPLDYARVDAMRLEDGTLAVSELEATEPGLYLEVAPDNAEPFARLCADRFRRS
jgi:hypothetical protein